MPDVGTSTDSGPDHGQTLRYDGLYVDRKGDGFARHYLRFYRFEDSGGCVCHSRASLDVTDAQVARWLHMGGSGFRDDWQSRGTVFWFTETWPGGSVEFEGQVTGAGSLRISGRSQTEGRAFTDRIYTFVADAAL